MMEKVYIYDTTLRDGSQGPGINFSLEDKLKIAEVLDELGVHYIEGGWPGSNPKDIEFFKRIKKHKIKAKIVAFGSTRRKKITPSRDKNLRSLIKVNPDAFCIFGKTWLLHVEKALKTDPEENLKMIYSSVKFLKRTGKEVIYDAEHFFDGYKHNRDYALLTLKEALRAGADWIVLCDTNGGCLPGEIERIVREVVKNIKGAKIGIHAHNDTDCGVANSLVAIRCGARMVQGTINGYGERCGNANLCSVIPGIELKLNMDSIGKNNLKKLTRISRYVDEIANLIPRTNQPYVGEGAFAHKGGVHVSAVGRDERTYEHIPPEAVGNKRKIIVSELAGKSNLLFKAKEYKIDIKDERILNKVLKKIKKLEYEGYEFEGAEGSFKVLLEKEMGENVEFFEILGYRVIVEEVSGKIRSEATVKVKVKERISYTVSEGDGPVNALDNALRKALENFYPELNEVTLTDFKVRVINPKRGTAAKVRVFIESKDREGFWVTVGVSENIIEASFKALIDGIMFKLLKEKR